MITKITDEVINKMWEGKNLIFTSFKNNEKGVIIFNKNGVKFNNKIVHSRNLGLGWSDKEFKKYLSDLRTIGTLEWMNNED